MLTMEQARERVARGAKLLDEKRPGWAERIDCGTLSLSGSCTWILGQLEDDFWIGAYLLFAPVKHWNDPDNQYVDEVLNKSRGTGFHVGSEYDHLSAELRAEYKRLQDAWIEEIANRVVRVETPQPVTVAS